MTTPDSSHDQASASHDHDEQLPEEPKTPFWLTALGVALLVSGGLGYLMVHEPTEEPEAAPAAVAEPEAKPPAEPPARAEGRPRRRAFPPGAPPSGLRPTPPIPDLKRLGRPPRPQRPAH